MKPIPESVKTGPSFKLSGIRGRSEHKINDMSSPHPAEAQALDQDLIFYSEAN